METPLPLSLLPAKARRARLVAAGARSNGLRGKAMVLGLGAQKAGTTWLHRYLIKAPRLYSPLMKEMHLFDVYLRPHFCAEIEHMLRRRLAALEARAADEAARREPTPWDVLQQMDILRRRREMLRAPEDYLHFFGAASGPAPIVADMTPDYSVLSVEDMLAVRGFFDAAGVEVRPLFMMRDPVDRLYSRERSEAAQGAAGYDPIEGFEAALDDPRRMARGRYDLTLEAIDAAFGDLDPIFVFYETMFAEPEKTLENVARRVGVMYRPPETERKINASAPAAPLPPALEARAVEAMGPVYEAVRARFGDAAPRSWRG